MFVTFQKSSPMCLSLHYCVNTGWSSYFAAHLFYYMLYKYASIYYIIAIFCQTNNPKICCDKMIKKMEKRISFSIDVSRWTNTFIKMKRIITTRKWKVCQEFLLSNSNNQIKLLLYGEKKANEFHENNYKNWISKELNFR